MATIKKDNLQKLIKSLSKIEKKFFKESLKKEKQNKLYLQLFNLIDKKSNPTQQEFKQLFDTKANQLAVIKIYLTKLILKSLKNFHQNNSTQIIIYNNFLEIQLLLQKELFDLAEFKINKILKLAHHSEQLIPLLQILDLQKQFFLQKFGQTNEASKKSINAIIEEQNQILAKIYNLHQYQNLQNNFYC